MMRSILAVAVPVPLVAGCAVDAARQTPGAAQSPAGVPFQVQVVSDFESPWAMTFLPDGRMLITEKAGTLYVVSADGQQRKGVDGIPAVSSEGQGGLMDVVLHPGCCTRNRLVYFSYAEAGQSAIDSDGRILHRIPGCGPHEADCSGPIPYQQEASIPSFAAGGSPSAITSRRG